MEEKKELMDKLKEQVEASIERISKEGIQSNNIETLYKLVDIHKDIKNEEYWKVKEENSMRYRDYSGYGEDYGRENYGRSYGRRGVQGTGRGRYRGEDALEEMHEHYGNYRESANYNGQESDKAFEYMLKSAEEFFTYLMEEVENPEQMEKIKRTARKISEMRM